jgi:hypothetical protein
VKSWEDLSIEPIRDLWLQGIIRSEHLSRRRMDEKNCARSRLGFILQLKLQVVSLSQPWQVLLRSSFTNKKVGNAPN